ncbi:MAG TPA: hypothetical protein VIQ30_15295 [Pseudonocardia sp.]
MKPYAERLPRLGAQLLADVLAVGWAYVVVRFATMSRDLVLTLQTPANGLTDAGTAVRDVFASAAGSAQKVPFVGAQLADALRGGQAAGSSLADVGRSQYETVASVGSGTALVLVLVGLMPLVLGWLPLRVHYARIAREAAECRRRDLSLLALRALTRVRVRALTAVSADPAAAWRREDTEAVSALAALELRRLGLHPPKN